MVSGKVVVKTDEGAIFEDPDDGSLYRLVEDDTGMRRLRRECLTPERAQRIRAGIDSAERTTGPKS